MASKLATAPQRYQDRSAAASTAALGQSSACLDSELDDHDPTVVILINPIGLNGRAMYVQRELQTRLLGIGFSPLSLFAPANLLDDERG
jgi:hypothetical protein